MLPAGQTHGHKRPMVKTRPHNGQWLNYGHKKANDNNTVMKKATGENMAIKPSHHSVIKKANAEGKNKTNISLET